MNLLEIAIDQEIGLWLQFQQFTNLYAFCYFKRYHPRNSI